VVVDDVRVEPVVVKHLPHRAKTDSETGLARNGKECARQIGR
jgi:hypothetical protein